MNPLRGIPSFPLTGGSDVMLPPGSPERDLPGSEGKGEAGVFGGQRRIYA